MVEICSISIAQCFAEANATVVFATYMTINAVSNVLRMPSSY